MSRWIWLSTDLVLHDPRVHHLTDREFRFWIGCLCVAGEHDGRLPGLLELAVALRVRPTSCREMLKTLREAELLPTPHEPYVNARLHREVERHSFDSAALHQRPHGA